MTEREAVDRLYGWRRGIDTAPVNPPSKRRRQSPVKALASGPIKSREDSMAVTNPSPQTAEEEGVVDATVVDEPGTDLEPAAQSATLFRTDDPVLVVERASQVAQALKDVLTRQGMVQRIQGRDHVKVEGWQTLGSMLGIVPVVVWTRELADGWEARVEARTLDGRIVGAAEAMCTTSERTWKSRDPYALRSMAQTRATSKALRGPLGFVVTLAGYDATPAEEIPSDAAPLSQPAHEPRRSRADVETTGKSDVTPEWITSEQYTALKAQFAAQGNPVKPVEVWLAENAPSASGQSLPARISSLTFDQANGLMAFLTGGRS